MRRAMKDQSRNRFSLVCLVLLLIVGLFLIGFFPRFFERQKLDRAAAQNSLPIVRILQIKADNKKEELILPSSTVAFRITPIWARVDGYLSNLLVDIGDKVCSGQLLSVLDTPELDAQVDEARGELARSIANRAIARITANRWNTLYEQDPGATTKQEVDEHRYAYTSSRALVYSARANLRRLKRTQNFKNIVAPFDGIITERNIDLGSLISAGSNNSPQQLFTIANTDIIRVFVNVPQYYFRSIQTGIPAEVTIAEFQNKVFKGTVVRTANALDPIARTLLTEIYIDNKEGELFPGLYAEVKFTLDADINRFIIPTEALIIRSGPPQVAVVNKNHTIEFKTVTIGIDNGSSVEIVEGLQWGDNVVINPNERIQDGIHVQLAE